MEDAEAGNAITYNMLGVIALFVLLAAFLGFFAFLSYRRFLWEITSTDIHIYSGVLFKKQVHIPFHRVQSIDFNAGVIDRIIGIVRLKIETAGGARNKAVLIPSLKLNEAEALRAEVFARKRMAAGGGIASAAQTMPVAPQIAYGRPQTAQGAGGLVRGVESSLAGARGMLAQEYYEEAPLEYEYRLTAKELLLSALSSDHNYVTFLIIVGFLSQIPEFLGLFVSLDGFVYQQAFDSLAKQAVSAIILGVFVFAALLFVLTIIGTAVSYGGFKARRRGGRIEVEQGLLARRYKSVAIQRIQSVEVKQGFIRGLIGYAELRLHTIDALDSGNEQNKQGMSSMGVTIHPFIKKTRIDELLAGLVPEFNERPQEKELRKLPPVALRRTINRSFVFPALIIGVPLALLSLLVIQPYVPADFAHFVLIGMWALYAIVGAYYLIGAFLWKKHSTYTYNQRFLAIKQGTYGTSLLFIPRSKIQYARTKQSPLQRLAKVATIEATTAAGVGGTHTRLCDLRVAEADKYLDWVRPSLRR